MSSLSLRFVPRLLPAAALVACAGLAAWRDYGSILAPDWLPYAIVLALVVGAIALSGAAFTPEPLAGAGVLALLLLAAWVGLSARWSPAPSLARDEALLTALYAVALLIPLLTIGSAGERLGAVGGGLAGGRGPGRPGRAPRPLRGRPRARLVCGGPGLSPLSPA